MTFRFVIISFFLTLPVLAVETEIRIAWKVVNLQRGESVNMRADANPSAAVIVKVPHDAGIVDANGDCKKGPRFTWCPVIYNEQNGWIADQYLQKVRIRSRTRKVAKTEAPAASPGAESPNGTAPTITPSPEAAAPGDGADAASSPSAAPAQSPAEAAAPQPATSPAPTNTTKLPLAEDKEGLFFVYHQLEPKKRPTGCVPIDAEKLPPVDQLDAQERAIGKRVLKTTCCLVNYLYFGRLSDCQEYLRTHDIDQEQETEPVTVPADH